ncbi:sensory box sensor/ggdef/eal domain protein [Nautilia profundicola AmH]|uniref:Sensory box sensor/ggdef/eal domain protein n=1 Tax=Nautilia profundicola (strain ATCC BAA-1463 / DSM 18972 / AmH) TaxID=598659 RepID=B9L6X7_NAUPA|nr:EAL domain-containing protein [Nautilia profundicola]ACM92684.1 sensory box sensor/ggdef/eal domain protein [Nautilia profundicola AmH]
MDFKQILEIFNKQPYVAIMLYKEKIIYANKKLQELLGFSYKELSKMSAEEVFPPGPKRNKIKEVVKKRLEDQEFPATYEPMEILNKNNKRLIMKFFTQTIKLNDGSYAGLVFGIDVTGEYKKEFLIDILKEINQTIITQENEEEIYTNIVKQIYKKGNYEFVCASIKKFNSDEMDPKYCIGNYDEDFLNFLRKIFKADPDYANKCLATKYMLENKFMIVNDLTKIDFPNKKLIQTLLDKNFRSILFFPIFKNHELYSAIGICSKYVDDFDSTSISIFQEGKQDIEFALQKSENIAYLRLLQEALDKAYSWVVITDENANILYANKSVEDITGYSLFELLGKNPRIFKSGYHSDEFYKRLWEKLTNNEVVETILINKDKNNHIFYLKDKIVPITAPNGQKYYISLAIDITHEKTLQNKLKKDILTDLPNRNEFINLISNKIHPGESYACIIIDLRDFKIFNQLNGNAAGDYLLRKFADFIKTVFYEEDIIARIGGDEFAVFIKYNSINDLYSIIHKIIYKVKHLEDFHNKISVNIGISLYPKDSENITELIEKAFLALEIAKEKGDFTYEFFNPQINQKIIEYSDIKKLIVNAIKNEEFIYHFQPYVNTKTLKIVGAETLLRIKHSNKIIYPNAFIDFAENSGYIKEIEKIMFPKYIEYLKELNIPLSFNVSGKSLTDENHIEQLFGNIEKLPIIIELTEREIAGNIEYTKEIFRFFKEKKFKLSIDDFGTGYSSLTYLKDLPADYLKIDMSFIKNIETSEKDLAIVETIINFAHKFNLKTIAEGVETEKQVKILKELNCDYLQGFYFAKPMPLEEFKNFLNSHKNS